MSVRILTHWPLPGISQFLQGRDGKVISDFSEISCHRDASVLILYLKQSQESRLISLFKEATGQLQLIDRFDLSCLWRLGRLREWRYRLLNDVFFW
ncbi:MAG: hypothetical protein IH892_13015 [Planctomycetes bacterium]|nr:hypothetical protein [Planctomycetota bacterium]